MVVFPLGCYIHGHLMNFTQKGGKKMDKKKAGTYYSMTLVAPDLIVGKFGPEQADNDKIAADVQATLSAWKEDGTLSGGPYPIKFDGPASIQVSSVFTHELGHIYGAVAMRDPKMFVPGDLEYVVSPGTKWELQLKVAGTVGDDGTVLPDKCFVVTVVHGNADLKVGDVIN